MMTEEQAVALVRENVQATVEVVKAVNSGRGIVSKAKRKREIRAAHALFRALTGATPSPGAILEMVGD